MKQRVGYELDRGICALLLRYVLLRQKGVVYWIKKGNPLTEPRLKLLEKPRV